MPCSRIADIGVIFTCCQFRVRCASVDLDDLRLDAVREETEHGQFPPDQGVAAQFSYSSVSSLSSRATSSVYRGPGVIGRPTASLSGARSSLRLESAVDVGPDLGQAGV